MVGGGEIGERNFFVNWLLDDGRAPAGDHENYERGGVLRAQRFENGFGSANGFGGGCGMSAMKVAESTDLSFGLDQRGDDAFQTAAYLRFECGGHGVRGFADGDYENATVGVEIVEVVANTEDSTLAVDVTSEGTGDGGVLERGGEDGAGGVAHGGKLLQALWRDLRHSGI